MAIHSMFLFSGKIVLTKLNTARDYSETLEIKSGL